VKQVFTVRVGKRENSPLFTGRGLTVNSSKRLQKERGLAFYGDIDLLLRNEFNRDDALEAIKEATFIV